MEILYIVGQTRGWDNPRLVLGLLGRALSLVNPESPLRQFLSHLTSVWVEASEGLNLF